ncbi:MAG: M20/M25/M40 family metallo-hydrolase [Acidobacteria bacterium]|nr:M20/M25/M40 family metallo-hydrolase [Acidobacteriota bacterium]
MAESYVSGESTRPLVLPQWHFIAGLLVLGFIAFLVYLSIAGIEAPRVVGADAAASEFSAARAMRHAQVIGRTPHPIGSIEHAKTREYIQAELTALGVSPQVQTTTVVSPVSPASGPGRRVQAGTVHNVIGRLNGTGAGTAVMIMAHYDSAQTSSGASDNGASVAAMLETLRALKATPALKNDLIFLFTDAEETGLLGARAFVSEHPWARDVAAVLNFEARGTTGPSLMFETSNENGWLIKQLAQSAPKTVASSLFTEIYKRLPNSTDLGVFKEAGYSGLNFAYTDGFAHYHTLSDNVENLDQRSLQHHGSYALMLSQALGNADLNRTKAPNHVYFSVPGLFLIHYSETWVRPVAAIVQLLLVGVLWLGLRKKHLTISGMILGFFAVFGTGIAASVVVTIVNLIVRNVHSEYRLILQGTTYNNELYVLSFVSFTVAVVLALHNVFRKRIWTANLMAGGLIWCAILMGVTSWLVPGVSYLFTWPLLFSLLALGIVFAISTPNTVPAKHLPLFVIAAVPAIALLVPIIYLLSLGLSLSLFRAVLVLIVLVLVLMLPLLEFVARSNKWVLPSIALVAGIIFAVQGHRTTHFTKNDPKPTDVFYALNADNNTAVWASANVADEWTSQFFPEGSETSPIPDYVPFPRAFLHSSAPKVDLAPPVISPVTDVFENGVRRINLNIRSQRQAPILSFSIESDTELTAATINGRQTATLTGASPAQAAGPSFGPMSQGGPGGPGGQMARPRWGFSYYAPPEQGIDVALETKSHEPIRVRVVEQSYGLPDSLLQSLRPRPDYMMPTPYPYSLYSDSTLVSKRFDLHSPSQKIAAAGQ